MNPLCIMIAGPYRGGAQTEAQRAANLRVLNEHAWEVVRRGHIPVIGVNAALPIIEVAGTEHFDRIMMPVSLALAERCDAVLRIGGASTGADEEVAIFRSKGLPVFYSLDEIPRREIAL